MSTQKMCGSDMEPVRIIVLFFGNSQLKDYHLKVFETNDPNVRKWRDTLSKMDFGWIKFSKAQNCKYSPGFIHPVGGDKRCARKIGATGSVGNITKFFDYKKNVDVEEKGTAEISALKRFNKKFNFSFE